MAWINGALLPPQLRDAVLRTYVYRMTHESRRAYPSATMHMLRAGHVVAAVSDDQWLATRYFYVTSAGQLSSKHRYAKTDDGLLDARL